MLKTRILYYTGRAPKYRSYREDIEIPDGLSREDLDKFVRNKLTELKNECSETTFGGPFEVAIHIQDENTRKIGNVYTYIETD